MNFERVEEDEEDFYMEGSEEFNENNFSIVNF